MSVRRKPPQPLENLWTQQLDKPPSTAQLQAAVQARTLAGHLVRRSACTYGRSLQQNLPERFGVVNPNGRNEEMKSSRAHSPQNEMHCIQKCVAQSTCGLAFPHFALHLHIVAFFIFFPRPLTKLPLLRFAKSWNGRGEQKKKQKNLQIHKPICRPVHFGGWLERPWGWGDRLYHQSDCDTKTHNSGHKGQRVRVTLDKSVLKGLVDGFDPPTLRETLCNEENIKIKLKNLRPKSLRP